MNLSVVRVGQLPAQPAGLTLTEAVRQLLSDSVVCYQTSAINQTYRDPL